MKSINLKLIILSLILSSCQNEESVISGVREIQGYVSEEFSFFHNDIKRQPVSNVSVRLMHNGVTLDEVNTNDRGKFIFSEQSVPKDEAYLLFEALGFYRNVARVIEEFDSGGMGITPNDYFFELF